MILNGHVGYQTQKRVFIPGPYLFCVSSSANIFIAIYVIGYHFFWKNGHMLFEDISSTHHVSARHPTHEFCDPLKPGCRTDFQSLDALDYCLGGSPEAQQRKKQIGISMKRCEYTDSLANAVPLGDDNILITTHCTMVSQTVSELCKPIPANNYTCMDTFHVSSNMDFYVADVERFWLVVDHTAEVANLNLFSNAFASEGHLWYKPTESEEAVSRRIPECMDHGEPTKFPNEEKLHRDHNLFSDYRGDHLQLSEVLLAAGLDLDREMSIAGVTRRESGVIVRLSVLYENAVPGNMIFGTGDIHYSYSASVLRTPVFQHDLIRGSQKIVGALSDSRLVIRKRGIYIDIVVSGRLGRFSFSRSMLTLVSAMAIVTAAQFIVQHMATNRWLVGRLRAEKNEKALREVVSLPTEEERDHFEVLLHARSQGLHSPHSESHSLNSLIESDKTDTDSQ